VADNGDDRFLDSLNRLVADAVAEEAARSRSQTRVLRQIAEEEATFAGIALDLAERRVVVVARSVVGRPHRGVILAVGRDFAVVRDGDAPPVLLATGHLSSIRPQPGTASGDTAGARLPALRTSLAAVLTGLAAERPRVQMMAVGDEQPLSGELRSVGADVATLRLDGDGRLVAYFRLPAVAVVVLLDAG
jgi:hypothetical protein